MVNAAAEEAKLLGATLTDPAAKTAIDKQIEAWHSQRRYTDEGRGRKELQVHATEEEEDRDVSTAKYHHYEIASAAFQIGIVLCSAAVITGIMALVWFAGGLGVVGIVVMALGLFAPHILPLP